MRDPQALGHERPSSAKKERISNVTPSAKTRNDPKARARLLRIALAVLGLSCVVVPVRSRAHDDPGQTMRRLDAQIAANPTDAELWRSRAVLSRRARDFEHAHADLDRAVELGLDAAPAHRDRGLIRFEEDRFAEAEALLRLARELAPQELATLLGHARALAALHRFDESASTYAAIVELAPSAGPDVRLEHIRVAASGGGADALGDAIRVADAAIAAIGSVPALEQAALDLELRADRVDAALARLDRVARGSARRDTILLQRAEILERAGRTKAAEAAYAEALAASSSLPDARRSAPAVRDNEVRARDALARLAGESE